MTTDALGDRMKRYEEAEAGRRLMPRLPMLARLDGRSFSQFTKTLEKPYDVRLSKLLVLTTRFLAQETNANCGYTQSDEITLCWHTPQLDAQLFFDGRVHKLVSTLAAMAAAYFNRRLAEHLPSRAHLMPTFDCRVWNVPTLAEGVNAFLWRERDATKNSISSAARQFYSHAELQDRGCAEMQELLFQKGVNWNDYPSFFKRGTYVQRQKVSRQFTAAELAALPERHAARENPDLVVERTEHVSLILPPLATIENCEEVIFYGAAPRKRGERPDNAPRQEPYYDAGSAEVLGGEIS